MYISFERSGGVTGIPITITIDTDDTDSLSSNEVSQLCQLVENSGFFELPTATAESAQPDRFQYKVIVREGDRQHTVIRREATVPTTLKPLLNWLVEAARRR
jgi:hypothetical protein